METGGSGVGTDMVTEPEKQESVVGVWKSDEINCEFFKKSLVGSVMSIDNMKAMLKVVSNILKGSRIKYLGGKQVLIHFDGEEELQSVEREPRVTLLDKKNSRRWTEGYRASEKLTWLRITRVPVHRWNKVVFTNIATNWGQVM